jgi:ectoine hydroxylase-related dioxygenase (phytanoyl-CoA dioxygenase family)
VDRTDHPFVTVDATPDELGAGALADDRAAAVVESLRVHGAAVVRGAVDLDLCDRLHDAMMAELDLAAAEPHALGVRGHVQHNPPPRADCLFPGVFANPFALAAARALMGPSIQLLLYTGNTMLSHTEDAQPVHWDSPNLWPALREAPPPASLIANVPLVDVDVDNGALELWPGTHLDVRSGDRDRADLQVPGDWLDARRAEVPPVRAVMPRGSLLLRDGRLWHRGTTNSTDHPRPMVAMLYGPAWHRPLVIDFYTDAKPVLERSGLRVTARYREHFNHHAWPPSSELVPKPVG